MAAAVSPSDQSSGGGGLSRHHHQQHHHYLQQHQRGFTPPPPRHPLGLSLRIKSRQSPEGRDNNNGLVGGGGVKAQVTANDDEEDSSRNMGAGDERMYGQAPPGTRYVRGVHKSGEIQTNLSHYVNINSPSLYADTSIFILFHFSKVFQTARPERRLPLHLARRRKRRGGSRISWISTVPGSRNRRKRDIRDDVIEDEVGFTGED